MNSERCQAIPGADHAQILEQVGVAVISINASGLILSVNQACVTMFGYLAERLLGSNVSILMPEHHARSHDDYLYHHLRSGESRIIGKGRYEEGRRADGTLFPIHLSVGRHEHDGDVYFTGIVHDLSEQERIRKQMLDAVEQSRKVDAIVQLTGGIAHDFNNLLTVISGNLELMELSLVDEAQRELVSDAQKAASRGALLTERLLSSASQSALVVQRLSLNDVILDLSDLLRKSIGEQVSLHTILSPDVWALKNDLSQIDSTLLNLTINARDAMPDGGRLTIETRNHRVSDHEAKALEVKPGDYVELIVTDTGRGINPEHLQRVFDPFFTTKPRGTYQGLGLSMVYGFAKQSGGSLRVESDPGRGARFSMLLPSDSLQSELPEQSLHAVVADPTRSVCILLVEDEEGVRRLTTRRLLHAGHTVIEAENAAEALVLFCDHPEVDILFTDMVMPGSMSGWDLFDQVRTRSPSLPVIISSGYSEGFNVEGKKQSAGLFILQKPYSMNSLHEVLSRALAYRASD